MSTAVVQSPRANVAVRDVAATLEKHRDKLAPFLRNGVTADEVIGQVKLAVYNLPALAKCTPESVFEAVSVCCQWGAEIGREAHLVPYNTKVKYFDANNKECERQENRAKCIADYKFLCDLVVQVGGARAVSANVVYDGCTFEYVDGAEPILRHIPWSVQKKAQGDLRGAYAMAFVGFGQHIKVWIPVAELERLRQAHSKQWKNGAMPDWWAQKTALRRLIKTLPKNQRMAERFKQLQKIAEDDEAADMDGMVVPAIDAGAPVTRVRNVPPGEPEGEYYDNAIRRYGELIGRENRSAEDEAEIEALITEFPDLCA